MCDDDLAKMSLHDITVGHGLLAEDDGIADGPHACLCPCAEFDKHGHDFRDNGSLLQGPGF